MAKARYNNMPTVLNEKGYRTFDFFPKLANANSESRFVHSATVLNSPPFDFFINSAFSISPLALKR